MTLHRGDKVTYIPFPDADKSIWEKGKVKYDQEHDEDFVFVVYKCNDEWSRFSEYTGARTKITDLKLGW